MYIVGTFQHSTSLELALKAIEKKGIERKNVLCIPLDKKANSDAFFDTIHRTDGKSTMGVPFFLGTCFSLLGAIYGFLWTWGPIIWSGLGFLLGVGIGILINFLLHKRHSLKDNLTEVIVLIYCEEDKEEELIEILWSQYALGVGKLYR